VKFGQSFLIGSFLILLILFPMPLPAVWEAIPRRVEINSNYQRAYFHEKASPVSSISNYWIETGLKIWPVEGYERSSWVNFLDQAISSTSSIDGDRCRDYQTAGDESISIAARSKQYSSGTLHCLSRTGGGPPV